MKAAISWLTLAIATTPAITVASPVYLECEIYAHGEYGVETFKVTLDEGTHSATHIRSNGHVVKLDAAFTANKISYAEKNKYDFMTFTTTYEIDRSTLDLMRLFNTRYFEGPKANTEETKSNPGKCVLVEAPTNRAI